MSRNPHNPLSMSHPDLPWFEADILERFGRYVTVHTTSDHHSESCPSTPGQWDLARILMQEFRGLGIDDLELTEYCYVRALLPGNVPGAPTIGFLAHLDTSPDCEGRGVKPVIHRDYTGGILKLPSGLEIGPENSPALSGHVGKTIITSDGTTLLGADDKAGIAEIMAAVRWLIEHPDVPRGDLEIIFTPDEEIGRGVDRIPREHVRSGICYTLDGDEEGTYNAQCFNGWSVTVTFRGRMIHPGDARGRLVNPLTMAGTFISMLPRNESPEATDGLYGYYCPQEIHGSMEETMFTLFIRDFDAAEIERRLAYLRQLAITVEGAFPGGTVTVQERKSYLNMYENIMRRPEILRLLEDAIRDTGIHAKSMNIRGGTDGARLTEMGIPTPNIFAGGHNFHSPMEWVPLQSMVRASMTIINLAQRWALGM